MNEPMNNVAGRAAVEHARYLERRRLEKALGFNPSVFSLSVDAAVNIGIGDIRRLPAKAHEGPANDEDLQCPTCGTWYFLVGYSSIGTGDVIRGTCCP